MAAANWDPSPGAGSHDVNAVDNNKKKDLALYATSIRALQDLADALPGFITRLKSKADLEARQRELSQSGGSIEQTGSGGEQVQLRLSERVGEGTFCVVYKAKLLPKNPLETQTIDVAAKFELRKTDSTQLRNEFRMYKKFQHSPGVAKIYSFGEMDFHKVLVMDLLGPSLEAYLKDCGRRFSIKTVCMLAKQMISRVQAIHEYDLIYRDIKPENFLMGLPSTDTANMVYLIDYGMAKAYRDPETHKHIPYGEAQSLSGTARYMSINSHRRCTQSRRDDLEALGHVFLYFLRGNLPWQGVKALQNDQRYDQMCEKKQATTIDDLCRGFPAEFAEYLTYTRNLSFDGDPDYDHLRSLFTKIMDAQGDVDDRMYDWIKPAPSKDDAERSPDHVRKPATISPVTATPPKSAKPPPPQHPAPLLPTTPSQHTRAIKHDATPDAGHPATPQHAPSQPPTAAFAPASPPSGKRGRAEFASELQPPTRNRPRRSTRIFYDSEAQRALVTLYREVMAKRYTFYRAVRQNRAGGTSVTSTAATTAALIARTRRMAGSYNRQLGANQAPGPTVILQSFTDQLDKTLGKAISELEEMSDKLLQDGDWSGAPRVQAWLEEANTATRNELRRLQLEMDEEKKKQGQEKEKDTEQEQEQEERQCKDAEPAAAAAGGILSSPTAAGPITYASALRQPGQQHGQRPGGRVLIDVDPVQPPATADKPRPGQQRHFQSLIDMTPLEALEVDENPDEDELRIAEMDLRARYSGRRGTTYAAGGFTEHRQPSATPMPGPGGAVGPLAPSPAIRADAGARASAPPNIQLAIPTVEPISASVPAAATATAPLPSHFPRASPSAAVRTGIDELSITADPIEVDDTIGADGGGGDDDDDEPIDLVYRTASGRRKVMRVPHRG